jgi:hypothetical protein
VIRQQLQIAQNNRCAICQGPITTKPGQDPVLDHDHKTGAVRAVLHRSCNSLLGKVENNSARFGVRDIAAFCSGTGKYLMRHTTNITGMLHSTHLTEDEKRIKRNKQVVKARIAKKKPLA